MRFDPQGIDLVQAVTVTLQNAPDIQLAEASALQALGAAQTQIGAFDTNFLGDTNYNYQRQMLSPNDFLGEVLKRQDLIAARDGEVANLAKLNALRAQLTIMQNLPAECGTANVSAQLAALRRLDPETGAEMDILDALCASAQPGRSRRSSCGAICSPSGSASSPTRSIAWRRASTNRSPPSDAWR